jgi:hypothetical protein
VYLEYLEVSRALEQTAKEADEGTPVAELRRSLDSRWTVEDIKSIHPKQIEIKKVGSGYTLRAAYRAEVPFVANVSLIVSFDKTVAPKGR